MTVRSTTRTKIATTATRWAATAALPSASKKCQSSRLRHFDIPEIGLRGRVLFIALFAGLELAGIAWGQRTPDRALGFQMFNESSRITIQLFREVKGKRRPVLAKGGRWRAPDASGKLREYSWKDRVHYYPLDYLEASVHAKYGLDGQLFHLQAALDDFVRHIPEDTRTLALIAEVDTQRNGAPGPHVRLRAEKP